MDGYVTIHGWMLELGLNGRELNALAVIWSFGKDGEWFTGSASYLCRWMGVKNKHTAISALSSLVQKGILERRERWENGQRLCDYRPCQNLTFIIIDLVVIDLISIEIIKKLIIKKSGGCRSTISPRH